MKNAAQPEYRPLEFGVFGGLGFPLKFSSSACQLSSKEKKSKKKHKRTKQIRNAKDKQVNKRKIDFTVYSRFLRARHRAFYTGMGGV